MSLTTSGGKQKVYPEQSEVHHFTTTNTSLPLLLTPAQVARELSISRHSVYRLIRARQLKALDYGTRYRVRREDLLKFVERSGRAKRVPTAKVSA